jgi:predicted TIM-barrel fold metal-dependent hydrolase
VNPSTYFTVTDFDRVYYRENLEKRLPKEILDAHTHMNLPEHAAPIPQSRFDSDWALQSGSEMSVEDARGFAEALFPSVDYNFTAFPFPIKEADTDGNNENIASLIKTKKISYGLLTTRPWDKPEFIEEAIKAGGFIGIKPYPDYVSAYKGAEVSIPDFLPREHCALAERLNKCIVLHLPRSGRFADENNIKELKEIIARFPKIKIIIAHLGRCFNPCYFEKAVELMGEIIHHFWFDTAAVMNPRVLKMAMEILPEDRIQFGLDMPVLLFHGSRRWTETTYINVCREELPWNKHIEGKDAEAKYTFFFYEQINNILSVMEELKKNEGYKKGFFKNNAEKLFESCTDLII